MLDLGGEVSLMLLGRVIGVVVPCIVTAGTRGGADAAAAAPGTDGAAKGRTLVAADPTRMAGAGEIVTYEGGREAPLLLDPWFVPVDHAVVGIVDTFHLPGEGKA